MEEQPTLDQLIKTFALAGTLSQGDIYRLIAMVGAANHRIAEMRKHAYILVNAEPWTTEEQAREHALAILAAADTGTAG